MAFRQRVVVFSLGVAFGALISFPIYAQVLVSWTKAEVVAMVIVQPDTTVGFVPAESGKGALGNAWSKQNVVPVVMVQPNPVFGFVPVLGDRATSIAMGKYWTKDEVKPFIVVKPSIGDRFISVLPQ
jgi:hypothetical protein